MTQLPDYLKAYSNEAERYLTENLVREIEFSGGTYQVHVLDPGSPKGAWSFLQLDERGTIKDCFCSCETAEENTYCGHIAAAFLKIYDHHTLPLHQRFEHSLWNQLCQIFCTRVGDDPDILVSKKEGEYTLRSPGGNLIFYIKGLNPGANKKLYSLIENRPRQTEETSLKFSNLSSEEISLWREGKPSPELRYELSFWNDIAHWLLTLQEVQEDYKIDVEYSQDKKPKQINIAFSEVEAGFYVSESNLATILPALELVKSPSLHNDLIQNAIEKITYDKNTGTMLIKAKNTAAKKELSIRDPQWLLSSPKLSGAILNTALNEHARIIKKFLENQAIFLDPIPLSYTLSFNSAWDLHITGYAFTPGDLTAKNSHFLGNWVYIDNEGFYPIQDAYFKTLTTIIPSAQVSDFVREHRSWLNTQEGFYTHLGSIEAQLTYNVSAQNRLSFDRLLHNLEISGQNKDFGTWVYLANKGFYNKTTAHSTIPLQSDNITIGPAQIPLFIRMNSAELQFVKGFFSEKCPVAKAGLNLQLDEEEGLNITPEYTLLPEYADKNVQFFDDFTYVAGEGFSEIPASDRLPENYHHAQHLNPDAAIQFLINEINTLRPYISQLDPRVSPPQTLSLTAADIKKDNEDKGIYSLILNYETERGFIPLISFWNALKQKKTFLFSTAGLISLSSSRFDWIKLLPKKAFDKKNRLRLNTLELIRLNALEEISVSGSDASSQAMMRELVEFQIPSEPLLDGFNSHLRPYQKLGAHWLWFLYTHNLSGLLCDDMGLGKTHQAMALISGIYNLHNQAKTAHPHFLVVCPTSVMYHWQEKLKAFMPHLRVFTFYGSQRDLKAFNQDYDVLLTSYGIWRIENKLLSSVPFELAIFDEIQIAKNQNSRIHATLRRAKSHMTLGLTGTPIENHIREMKSLFDIVLPAYMPTETDYKDFFIKPIERYNDPDRKALLARFVKPFVLRRKKEDVLTDLPDKTEEIAHCNLMPGQLQLYNQTLVQSREKIMENLQDRSSNVPYIHIFALLSSLKQICNHPAAFMKTPEDYKNYDSGKWELFVELLNEARESNQKVVIFSQYLAMLDIFELYLSEHNIQFATIRGSTTNRGEQVHRFNTDPKCEVFLGSLHAAGLGVDLTAGSVVIHYDRWWNAARENQATDRVHRIGQTRGVQVFKMVTKGSFEERIDALIAKKGKLMEDVIGTDDHRILKTFNREEILQLLQEVQDPDPGTM